MAPISSPGDSCQLLLTWRQDGEWRERAFRSSDHLWRETHRLLAREGFQVQIHYDTLPRP